MYQKIEIRDSEDNSLNVDLKDILSVLPAFARDLDWYFLDIEASGEHMEWRINA